MKTKPLLPISYVLTLLSAECNKQIDSANSYDFLQAKQLDSGKTCVASKNGNIAQKENLQQQDKNGNTPLHHAAYKGHLAIVALLVNKGAKLEIKNKEGNTPLLLAVLQTHRDVVSLLINKGADVHQKNNKHQNAFYCALAKGDIGILKQILPKVKEINLIDPAQPTNSPTALNVATCHGHIEVVKLLIQQEVNINQKDKFGNTPLHHAAYKGHPAIVALLVNKGAKLEIKNKEGETPLAIAKEKGYTEKGETPLAIN